MNHFNEARAEMSDHTAAVISGYKNGRGGVFKAGLFGIDYYVAFGINTMATPDGRKANEFIKQAENVC